MYNKAASNLLLLNKLCENNAAVCDMLHARNRSSPNLFLEKCATKNILCVVNQEGLYRGPAAFDICD